MRETTAERESERERKEEHYLGTYLVGGSRNGSQVGVGHWVVGGHWSLGSGRSLVARRRL